MNETIDSVLRYWFGEQQTATAITAEKNKLWWKKNPQTDDEIESRFADLVEAVAAGDLDHWRESASGLLASIICTDQFPRNIHRNRSKAFAFDPIALQLAKQTVSMRLDQTLSPIKRVFVYLPYEHAEDLAMQEEAMRLFSALVDEAEEGERKLFSGYVDFARRHYDIIARFGRFPHRNSILGRSSTDEELAFLGQPGSSF